MQRSLGSLPDAIGAGMMSDVKAFDDPDDLEGTSWERGTEEASKRTGGEARRKFRAQMHQNKT